MRYLMMRAILWVVLWLFVRSMDRARRDLDKIYKR